MQVKKIKLVAPTSYQESLSYIFSKEISVKMRDVNKQRGEGKLSKTESWAYNGKMAEFAVYNTLIKSYKNVTPPDVHIYPIERKSNDADIIADGRLVHIKSAMNVSGFENSWMFSLKDPICETPNEMDIIALVITYPEKLFEAYFIKAIDLVGLYKPPYNQSTTGKAIYETDLKPKQ